MKATPENTAKWLNNQLSQSCVKRAESIKKEVEKKYEFSEGSVVRLQSQLDDTYRKQSSIFSLRPVAEEAPEPFHSRNAVIIAGAMLDYSSLRTAISLTQSAHSAGIQVFQFDISKASPNISRFFADVRKQRNAVQQNSRALPFLRSFFEMSAGMNDTLENGYFLQVRASYLAQLFGNIPKSMPVIAVDSWAAHAAALAGMERVINCIPDSTPHFASLADSAINAVQTHESWLQNYTLNALVKRNHLPVPLDKSNVINYSGHFVEIDTVKSIERDCKKRISRAKRGEPLRILLSVPGENCAAEMYRQVLRTLVPLVAPQKIALFINLGNNKNAWEIIKSSFSTSQSLVTTYFNKNDSLSFAHNAGSVSIQGIHVFLNEDAYTGVYLSNLLIRATDILLTEPDALTFFPVPKIFLRPAGEVEQENARYSMHVGDGILAQSFSALSRILQLMINDPTLIEYYCTAIVNNDNSGLYDGAYCVLESALRKKIARVMYSE